MGCRRVGLVTATDKVASFHDPCFIQHYIPATPASARNNIIDMNSFVSHSFARFSALIPVLFSSNFLSHAAPPLSVCGAACTMELVANHQHLPQMLPRRDKDSSADLCPQETQLA
ncbi:hypothetical protein SVAN01_04088 [Stagonosporopsis vannaccii]|nr:hypothetical protein SVAN01_04088 [Stagonosporopsis vannaccii]